MSLSVLFICFCLFGSDQAFAMMHGKGHRGSYGGYCRGPKWGWYGARRDIKTVSEVRELLAVFLRGTSMSIGEIREEESYFEADIVNGDGTEVLDVLIVDKRTCRIRSKY